MKITSAPPKTQFVGLTIELGPEDQDLTVALTHVLGTNVGLPTFPLYSALKRELDDQGVFVGTLPSDTYRTGGYDFRNG